MNKKFLMFGILGLFAVVMVSAGLVTYYGSIQQEVNVDQAVILECPLNSCSEGIVDMYSGDTLLSKVYTIINRAGSSRDVELESTLSVGIEPGEVITSYYKVQDFDLYGQHYGNNLDLELSEYDVKIIPSTYEVTYIVDFPEDATEVDVEISTENENYHVKYKGSDNSFYVHSPSLGPEIDAETFEDFKEGSYADNVVTFTVEREVGYEQTFAVHLMGTFSDIGDFSVSSFMTPAFKTGEGGTYRNSGTAYHEIIDVNELVSPFTMLADSNFNFIVVNKISELSDGINNGIITTNVVPVLA